MILLDAWRRVNETYALDKNHCTPYAVGGFFTMNKAFSWLLNRTRRFNVRFVFEDGDKHKDWIMDQFVRMDKRLLKGVRPSFESKELAPLQAADFVMWEQLNLAEDRLRNPKTPAPLRESFQELYSIKKQWGVIDEEKLVRFCEDFGVPKQGEDRVWDGPFRPAEPPQLTKLAGDQP